MPHKDPHILKELNHHFREGIEEWRGREVVCALYFFKDDWKCLDQSLQSSMLPCKGLGV